MSVKRGRTAAATLAMLSIAWATIGAEGEDKSTPKPTASKPAAAKPTATAAAPTATASQPKPPAAAPQAKPQSTAPAAAATKPSAPAATASPQPAVRPTPLSPEDAALVREIRAAKGRVTPIATAEVAAAHDAARDAVVRLDRYLDDIGENGLGWKQYLRWDDLRRELDKPADFDLAALGRIQRRFGGGFTGLEQPEFTAAADALERLIHLAGAAQNRNLAGDATQQLEAAAATIEQIGGGSPTAAQAAALGAAATWLRTNGQTPEIVAAIERRYSQPNLLVDISEHFVSATLGSPIDETEPVHDCILGTSISGMGRTIGDFHVDVVPNGRQAEFVAGMAGVNHSRTTGVNRSALIFSTGRTHLQAATRMYVNEDGFGAYPVSASASVNSAITGIGSTRGGLIGRIVRKVASKKAPQQKPEGDRIAGQHARQRLIGKFTRRMTDLIAQANDGFTERLRTPLHRFDAFPQLLRFSSSDDGVYLRVRQDAERRLAAAAPAPQAGDAPVLVRVHESLVANSAQEILAGRLFDQQRVQLVATSFLGKVPDRLQPDPDEEPFSITFADEDPVSVSFDGGEVTFTVRGKAFTNGDKRYEGMSISGRYVVSSDGRGLKAVRQGDFQILPLGFKQGEGRLNTSQTIFKRVLQRKFAKAFPAEIVREGGRLEGELAKLGVFYVSRVASEDGWLVVGVDRRSTGESIAERKPVDAASPGGRDVAVAP